MDRKTVVVSSSVSASLNGLYILLNRANQVILGYCSVGTVSPAVQQRSAPSCMFAVTEKDSQSKVSQPYQATTWLSSSFVMLESVS